MTAPRFDDNTMLDTATFTASAPLKVILVGLAFALALCLGTWGAFAADPTPSNPNTSLRSNAVDEAVVAVVTDHAYVTVDGQVVAGTGFYAPAGKTLTFEAYAEEGYKITSVFVGDAYGNPVPIVGGLPAFSISADGVVDGLTIEVETEALRPNEGLFVGGDGQDSDDADEVTSVVVVGQDVELVYDGEPHTVGAELLDDNGEPLADYFAVATTPTFTNVTDGAVEVPIDDVVIYNAEGVDVTSSFDIDLQPGTITITPAIITIVTPSDTKVYDGTPLTNDEMQLDVPGIEELMEVLVTIKVTGSQTEIGESPNSYTIDWGQVDPANYQIDETLGTLKVTANEAPIVITVYDAERAYDGKPLTSDSYDLAAPTGYTASVEFTGSQTEAGTSENAVKSFVLYDEEGNDVTDKFAEVKTVPGKLTVAPAELIITTPSAKKTYDGTPLTATDTDWVQGLVEGETATYKITGSQTAVGSSANTYEIEWDGTAKASNYRIVELLGTLTVEEAPAPEPANNGGSATNNGSGTPTNANTGGSASTNTGGSTSSGKAGSTIATNSAPTAYVNGSVTTQVETYESDSTPVSDTPNVTYLTPAATANAAGSTTSTSTGTSSTAGTGPQASANGNGNAASSPGSSSNGATSQPEAASQAVGDIVDAVTGGAEEEAAEEILDDDATPLAGIDGNGQAALSFPLLLLGGILLAAALVFLAVLLVRHRQGKRAI